MNFAEQLKSLMAQHEVSAYRISKETGIPQSMIGRWKQGLQTPTVEKIQILANYFDVSVDYLLGNTEQQKNKPTVHEDDELISKIESNPLLKELYQKLVQMDDEQLMAFSKIIGLPKSDPQDK